MRHLFVFLTGLLAGKLPAAAGACNSDGDCPAGQICTTGQYCGCHPGSYMWVRDGIERCRVCAAGCACPGGLAKCFGCSAGQYSPTPGAPGCSDCNPSNETSDTILNSGCDPDNYETPCANRHGPLGQIACRAYPPSPRVIFVPPDGAVYVPEYLPNGLPNVNPPYYDAIDHRPMVQQSY
jgi:hypothetical protein